MSLAIVGAGLVSPVGLTVKEHVFFTRANVPPPPPSPFVTEDGERVRVQYCPWLGAKSEGTARIPALAMPALDEAWSAVAARVAGADVKLAVVTRAGSSASADLARAAAVKVKARDVEQASGDAAIFALLEHADAHLGSGRDAVLVVLAVDSMIDLALLTALVQRGPSPFSREPPPPSEGAACVVVTAPGFASRAGLRVLGTIERSAAALAPSRDDNDDAPDGAAMTAVLGKLGAGHPLGLAYGQQSVDDLRNQEWTFATARNAARFGPAAEFVSVEDWTGRTGSAAGAMSLVFGLGALLHEATPWTPTPPSIVAWAISPDGLRGGALVMRGRS